MKKFIKAMIIRALHTFAQTMLATIGTTAVAINEVNWLQALSISGTAVILSILKSIVIGLPEVDNKLFDETDEEEEYNE